MSNLPEMTSSPNERLILSFMVPFYHQFAHLIDVLNDYADELAKAGGKLCIAGLGERSLAVLFRRPPVAGWKRPPAV